MNDYEFWELVREMRAAQQRREPGSMRGALELERRVDEAIESRRAELQAAITDLEGQRRLFE
jgi:hypothetical protein